ncbi:MAG: alpha/beta hydrolase [Dehalococcoidia bacterium]
MINRYIFYPDKELISTPADYDLPFEDVYFPTADGLKLHGWFVPGERDVAWLWFHGNAGNISHRLDNLRLLHEKLQLNVFLFDYRGYGQSQGRPSEKGTYLDGEAALNHLHSRSNVDPKRVILFGRSLGGGVAVELASRERVYGLILESPFTSVPDMAKKVVPLLPLGPIIRTKYDSLSKIGRVEAPLLVIHGDMDEIVPMEQGMRLYEAARDPKELYIIPGAGHNDTYIAGGEKYFQALARFVEGLAQ